MLLSIDKIYLALDTALSTGADFAEVFVERSLNKNITMVQKSEKAETDSIVDRTISGVGVRAYLGLRSACASTTDLSAEGVRKCALNVALSISDGKRTAPAFTLHERVNTNIHRIEIVPSSVSNREKMDLLREGMSTAYSKSDIIRQVMGVYLDVDREILVANSEGLLTGDRQIRTRMIVHAVAADKGENEVGSCAPGRRMGLEMFSSITPASIGEEAARSALVNISAGYCTAGVYPVAIENGFGGVIFHESTGHSLEASSVAYGNSEFCGRIGEKIANEKVTAIDDGTIPNAWGSIDIDDEGTPSQRKVLIENGVLKRYMVDRCNGRRMNMPSSGSARRQDYSYCPTSRMTNTYIAAGNDEDEDIIASIEKGIYAKKMGGGSVNPMTGAFNFAVDEAYMIENGKIAYPVRGCSLIGKGSEIIQKIDMVGKHMLTGQGMCGSSSGSVPTDVGQPLIRVSSITVGGR